MQTIQMLAYSNRYKGKCEVCQKWVQPDEGFICKDENGYVKQKDNSRYVAVWCKDHVPARKGGSGDRKLTAEGYVVTPGYEPQNIDLLRAMPGAKWNPIEKWWDISLDMGDRRRLLEIADKLKLDVAPELREIATNEQTQNAKEAGLYPFQVDGVHWLSYGNLRLLGDDMGLGKTVQTLVALPDNASALCIVPASLKYNWEAECKKWRPDLAPVVINGKGNFRFPAPGEVVIVNYDILPNWLQPVKTHENAKPWEVVVKLPLSTREACKRVICIVDEAHKCKNYKTLRSKRVKGACMVCDKVWALTGTPLENRPLDLWGVLDCLGMGRTVFGGFKRFIDAMNGTPQYARGRFVGYQFGTPKPIVPELMRRVMLRRLRHKVLPDLPKKTYHTIKVDLPKKLQKYMDKLWDEWGDVIEGDRELPPFEEFSTLRAQLAESRISAVMELIEDHEEQDVPLVVFSAHLAPVEACGEREGWEVITGSTPSKRRQEIVQHFQEGRLKGIALTIKAGGVGLNLTRAWKMIFVDQSWVPSDNQQAADRICRIGQTSKRVEIVNMVSDHALDCHLLELMAWKISVIEAALEKTIDAHNVESESETEGEFQSRMSVTTALVESLAESECQETFGPWPFIKEYYDIPF